MTECLIAFGGNLSNPKTTFIDALKDVSLIGVDVTRKSGLWQSPAYPPGTNQPDYLNAVIRGEVGGSAEDLMRSLLSIEQKYGRVRTVPNAPRPLDLDLLIFGNLRRDSDFLTLPHPRMLERAFVLVPATEIDTKWMRYLRKLPDKLVRQTRYVGTW